MNTFSAKDGKGWEDSEAFISRLASFFTALKLTELYVFFLNFNISQIKKCWL